MYTYCIWKSFRKGSAAMIIDFTNSLVYTYLLDGSKHWLCVGVGTRFLVMGCMNQRKKYTQTKTICQTINHR